MNSPSPEMCAAFRPLHDGLPACRRGFTLIELLVVVAIIALLISILLPSLDGARRQARQLQCLTNLNSIGKAAQFYADENVDWRVGGIMSVGNQDVIAGTEYGSYWTSILKYLNYDGKVNRALWQNQTDLRDVLRTIPQFSCQDHPRIESVLDYVSSAFPVPYPQQSVQQDAAGGGAAGDRYQPETPVRYVGTYRIAKRLGKRSAAGTISVTEGHRTLDIGDIRFHHFFFTSQLPFGLFPRIGNDQRHPGGLTTLFLDGHAVAMRLQAMDAGWPNSLGVRLRHFTDVDPQYQ